MREKIVRHNTWFNMLITACLLTLLAGMSTGCGEKPVDNTGNNEEVTQVAEEVEDQPTVELESGDVAEPSEESKRLEDFEAAEPENIIADATGSENSDENEGPTIIIIEEELDLELTDETGDNVDVTQYDPFKVIDNMNYSETRLLAFKSEYAKAILEDGQSYISEEAESFLLYIPYNESGVKEVTSNYDVVIADGYYALFPLTVSGKSFEIICDIEYNDGTSKSITVFVTVE